MSILRNTAFFLFMLVISLFFTACNSKSINIKTYYSAPTAWNNDNSAFAFAARNKLYRSSTGIAKFPDGGKSITVYSDLALYYYDINEERLIRIIDLNNLEILNPVHGSGIGIKLAFNNSTIYYKLSDASDYVIREAKKAVHNKEDLVKVDNAVDYVSKIYKYSIDTKKIEVIAFLPKHIKWIIYNPKYLSDLRHRSLAKITYAEWGMMINEIYPQSQEEYMQYIIKKNVNDNTLKAVKQQIVPSFNQDNIKYILSEMEIYLQELYKIYKDNNDGVYQESLKKSNYENYLKYMKKTKKELSL